MEIPQAPSPRPKRRRRWLYALVFLAIVWGATYFYLQPPFDIPGVIEEGEETPDLEYLPIEHMEADNLLDAVNASSLELVAQDHLSEVSFEYQTESGSFANQQGSGRVGSFTVVSTPEGDTSWSPDIPGRVDPAADIILMYSRAAQLPGPIDIYRIIIPHQLR